jgi:phenylalanyl-tRNA synthetase beta chain
MKISYNWLKQFINIPDDIEKHCELLTSLGLEVEGLEDFESVKGGLKGVVVGHVTECIQHPNADKLKLTKVDLGDQTVQIVCGAPNVAAGQKVPVATIGTTLYTSDGEPWKIKKGKIRGEESHGMICAEDELGIGQSHDGIMVLDEDLIPGTPLADVLDIENDKVIEIGLTPNRADAMSHLGVARDLRAGLAIDGELEEFITPSTSGFHVEGRSLKIAVEVEQPKLAPRYCGLTMTGLKVQESPQWIQNRLKAIGIQPKNNVVDITNYVMHEIGQPLHAFDANSIAGNEIIVKTLPNGTKFKTLDGVERELHEDDLMICDAEKPLCIAGVFGGENSGVSSSTTKIFLESAYFDPVSVRKTAKRHGLNTDASFRFERGIDPEITEYALKRAALLIEEYAGGEVSSDIQSFYPLKIENTPVVLPFAKINSLIGQDIPREEIKSILNALEIKVSNVTESGLGLLVPAYRNDVTRPVDVIEEILRVYGYDRVEAPTKLNATISTTSRKDNGRLQNIAAQQLVGFGFNEIMSNSLVSSKYHDILPELTKKSHTVEMLNPLSNDLNVMRQDVIYGVLEAIQHNINRRQQDLKFFEFGSTYHEFATREYTEKKCLAIALTGQRENQSWNSPAEATGFFDLKGAVITLFNRLGLIDLIENDTKNQIFSEGLTLKHGKSKIADIGLVSKKLCNAFEIEQEVYYTVVYWDLVLDSISVSHNKVKELSKFPEVVRDFALLVDKDVRYKQLVDIAFQTERKILKDVKLFDVYEGKNLPAGKKSYALKFRLLDEKKTLTDKQIDSTMKRLQNVFEEKLGASLR